MGDRREQALRVQFDVKLRSEFLEAQVMSDAGLLTFRELDEAFRLAVNASMALSDPRQGKITQHTTLAMLRRAVYGGLAGYEDGIDSSFICGIYGHGQILKRDLLGLLGDSSQQTDDKSAHGLKVAFR